MELDFLIKKEEKKLADFLGEKINLLKPDISPEKLKKFLNYGFDLHFLPKIEVGRDKKFTNWSNYPKNNFFRLIQKKKLTPHAAQLSGQWILIDGRLKPKKNYWWIARDDFITIFSRKFLKINLQEHCRRIGHQQYENDFLLSIFKANGFHSRFSITWQEINEIIKPAVAKFLDLEKEKIRLPRFIEWNFLANIFYPEWGKTSTWEWFNDRFQNGECLTGGSNDLSILGWDPPDFWSTQLGFRFLIEI